MLKLKRFVLKLKRLLFKTRKQKISRDLYLDDDCWQYVFKFIFNDDQDDNRCHFKSLSLVSKQFLSITNRLRFSLTVWNPTLPLLPRLFRRFTNLISLDLSCFYGDINDLLVQISHFPLKLTSLNISNQPIIPAQGLRVFSRNITTITSLICSNISFLHIDDLYLISDCFPFLQELDIDNNENHQRDFGIRNVKVNAITPMVFPKLRKINFSRHYNMDDQCLLHLSKNSEILEELVILRCPYLTPDGIGSVMRERPNLKSISITWFSLNNINSTYFIDSLVSLKYLTCIHFMHSYIPDELVFSIAMRGLPLRKFVLKYCGGYSYAGIFCLLSKCQSIQHLNLRRYFDFWNDQQVVDLSLFFGHLVSINLSNREMLTETALFSLIRNCPSLTQIKMGYTNIGKEGIVNSNSLEDFVVRPQVKSLHLAGTHLRDESIKMFASIFPNLQRLDLSDCQNISEEGIYQVLRRCCKIRYFNLSKCEQVKLHELNFEIPKLKVLNLAYTNIDDETLYVISKSCSGLSQLLLRSCLNVTNNGIMHVVNNCTQLREIDLANCRKLLTNIVDEMILFRPSMRKITISPCEVLNEKKRKNLLRYGCLLRLVPF